MINIVLLSIYSPKILMITNQLLPKLTLKIAANHTMYKKRHLLLEYLQTVPAEFLEPTRVQLVVKFDWCGIDPVAFAKALPTLFYYRRLLFELGLCHTWFERRYH